MRTKSLQFSVLVAIGIGLGLLVATHLGLKPHIATVVKSPVTASVSSIPGSQPAPTVSQSTCQSKDFSIAINSGSRVDSGAMGYRLALTNTGTSTCTLVGLPVVTFLNSDHQPVIPPASAMVNNDASTVALTPGEVAFIKLEIPSHSQVPGDKCPTASRIHVVSPHQTSGLNVAFNQPVCPGVTTSSYTVDDGS